MKNSLKNGKKVLSLVLSVLMIMSCFVFAPIASAADTLRLTVKITVTDTMSVSNVKGSLKLRVTDVSGASQDSADFFRTLAFATNNNQADLPKGRSLEFSFDITKEVSQISLITDVYTTWHNPAVDLGIKVEAWISPNGASIINGSSVTKKFSQCWSSEGDNFFGGKTHVLASGNELLSNNYPTYVINFIDWDGNTIKSEKVSFGASATAPALPTKDSDNVYHYTTAWDKGSSAWTGVRENADIKAVATPVEHTYGDWNTDTPAGCETAGSKTRTCSVCNYVQTQTIGASGHSYGDWVVTTPATCTTAGEKTKTCSKCGNVITEKIDTTVHNMVTVPAKAATCTEAGYNEYKKCTKCDYTEDYVVIPAAGHNFQDDWYYVDDSYKPTCEGKGTLRRDCHNEGCSEFETKEVDANGHTWVDVPEVPAKCEVPGSTAGIKCSVCGTWKTEPQAIAPLKHDFKVVKTVYTDCTSEGVGYRECQREGCDATDTVAVPPQGHSFAETYTVDKKATCETDGEKSIHCTRCDAKQDGSTVVIPSKGGHNWSDWKGDEATCTEASKRVRYCENTVATDEYEACAAYENENVSALGHDFSEQIIDEAHLNTPAGCTTKAVYFYDCSRCDTVSKVNTFEYGDVLGHDFTKKIVDNAHLKSDATCEAKAVYYYNCSRCNVISTEDTFEYGNALGHDYVGAITTRPTETEKGLATYTCTRDASHVYTLAMDLADYSGFDASLEALKEIAKKDLTAENKAIVKAAIAEAENLARDLIAGVKGQTYTDPLDQYKHDFGEQDLINAAKAKLDEAIKTITDKGDDAFNKYTVTFKDYDGSVISTETVVSGNSATAPADRTRACDADNHYTFTGWSGNYKNVTKNEEVTAAYKTEAHNYVENVARYVAPSKNEDGTWSDGVIVKECTGCSCEKSENIARADYESRYDPALEKVEDILNNPELDPTAKEDIEKTLKDHNIPIPEDYDKRDQKKVDDAADILEGIIGKYTDKDGDVKEEFLKKYTITFIWNGDENIQHLVKGAKIVAPSVSDYVSGGFNHRFLGWDKDVPETVTGDATFTAVYSQPRDMDDVKEVIKDAEEVINDDDYYDEDQKKVEDAKKELEDYLEDVGVDLDKDQNPVEKGSKEDEKITELVEKLRDAIDNAKKNKANRDNNKHQTSSFMHWLTRLLILVRHLLGMV